MSENFRFNVVTQINKLLLKGKHISVARQLEKDLYENAASKDEYVIQAVQLLREIKEKNANEEATIVPSTQATQEKTPVKKSMSKPPEKKPESVSKRPNLKKEDIKPDDEEALYKEKVRKLTTYIEPCEALIKKETSKEKREVIKKVLNFIKALRTSDRPFEMSNLDKCEQLILGEMYPFIKHPFLGPIYKSFDSQYPFQLAFLPIAAFEVVDLCDIPLPVHKQQSGDEKPMESIVLNRELAMLGRNFKVELDTFAVGSDRIHLICNLENDELPPVPPIYATIAKNYPQATPEFTMIKEEYCGAFLKKVQEAVLVGVQNLPTPYTLTQVLGIWERAVLGCTNA